LDTDVHDKVSGEGSHSEEEDSLNGEVSVTEHDSNVQILYAVSIYVVFSLTFVLARYYPEPPVLPRNPIYSEVHNEYVTGRVAVRDASIRYDTSRLIPQSDLAERVPISDPTQLIQLRIFLDDKPSVIQPFFLRRELLTPDELRSLLMKSVWPPETHQSVVNIAMCESPFVDVKGVYGDSGILYVNSRAVGDDGRAYGVMQIRIDYHPVLHTEYDLFNPLDNLNAAHTLYERRGSYLDWSCSSEYVGPR
jgi:hypothetical protein